MLMTTMIRGTGVACVAAALAVTVTHAAQENRPAAVRPPSRDAAYVVPRTPDGQPDIQGTWVNFDDTPFEASATARPASDVNPPDHWTEHGSPVSARRQSMVVDPPDGRVPILPAAEAARDEHLAHVGDHWIHETPWVRCITRGVPGGMFPAAYNNAYTIHQVPGYVVIVSEMIHDARIIPLDGRPRLADGIRQWNGDSRGRWEGTTLVVDTTNYNDRGMVGTSASTDRVRGVPATDRMHVVERITPLDRNTLKYEVTIDDPGSFSRPWTVMLPLNRDEQYVMLEYACHEGNMSLPNELRGGRAADAR